MVHRSLADLQKAYIPNTVLKYLTWGTATPSGTASHLFYIQTDATTSDTTLYMAVNGSWLPVRGHATGAALTTQLTTLAPVDAEGTPDYTTDAITNSSPYGFASAQSAITVLYVIANLQVRLAEVEARLEAAGIVAAN